MRQTFHCHFKDLQLYREILKVNDHCTATEHKRYNKAVTSHLSLFPPRFPNGRSKETSPWLQPGKHCAWYWTNAHWNVPFSQSPTAGRSLGSPDPQRGQHRHLPACSILPDHFLSVGFLVGWFWFCFVFPPQMALNKRYPLCSCHHVQVSL